MTEREKAVLANPGRVASIQQGVAQAHAGLARPVDLSGLEMTDRELLEEMFQRRGIVYDRHDSHGEYWCVYDGYDGFYASFEFDGEGSLIRVAAYE